MPVRVTHETTLPASPERVWEFIGDPAKRAAPISVVEDWTVHDDGSTTWEVAIPLPFVDSTVTVETTEEERRPPEYVRFSGRSRILEVTGEHELAGTDGETVMTSRFEVDGRLPGVERYFRRNLDDELANVEAALLADLEAGA